MWSKIKQELQVTKIVPITFSSKWEAQIMISTFGGNLLTINLIFPLLCVTSGGESE